MKKAILILVVAAITITSCKKQAGEGGNSTVTGKIWAHNNSPTFALGPNNEWPAYGQGPAYDVSVYIIYGDDATYGNKMNAGPDGTFEFQYLRKGSYKIYVYSKDSVATVATPPYSQMNPNLHAQKMAVMKTVEITKRKQTVDAGTLIINN